jgi:hypothetical protein
MSVTLKELIDMVPAQHKTGSVRLLVPTKVFPPWLG